MSEPTPPVIPTPSTPDPAASEAVAHGPVAPVAVAPDTIPLPQAPAPRRSFLDAASVRPTVIVAVIIAALFYGTQILNEALPAAASEVPVSAGGSVEIGNGATITPLAGWAASAHDGGDGIRLEKGIVAIDLFAETFGSSAVDLAESYRDQVLEADTTQFTATTIDTFTSSGGTPGAVFRYQGVFTGIDVPIEGEVVVLFDTGLGVVADAWTRQGDLDDALGEIHAMDDSIEVRP